MKKEADAHYGHDMCVSKFPNFKQIICIYQIRKEYYITEGHCSHAHLNLKMC